MLALRVIAAFIVSTVMVAFSPGTARAAESYDNCTGYITSIPATISTQGTWCFNQDLATGITSGSAITVSTNNVTIDCNDFKLGGLSAGLGTTAHGISAATRLNVTVRNCNIRGFYRGIYFSGFAGGGHAVEDSRFDANTYTGVYVNGDGSVVRRNRVFDTGGSTVTAIANGIYVVNSVDVIDNTVSGVVAALDSFAYGIYTDSDIDGNVNGNRVRGLVTSGSGVQYGIYNLSSGLVTLTNNIVIGSGGAGSVGLRCTSGSTGTAKDNVVKDFVTPLDECINNGGNVLVATP